MPPPRTFVLKRLETYGAFVADGAVYSIYVYIHVLPTIVSSLTLRTLVP